MKPNFKLPLTGRCQCRAVAYKITSAPLAVYACHCTECQRQSGSAFSLSLLAERETVVVEEGKPAVWERQHESGRVIDCASTALRAGGFQSPSLDHAFGNRRQELVVVNVFGLWCVGDAIGCRHRVDRELDALGLCDA